MLRLLLFLLPLLCPAWLCAVPATATEPAWPPLLELSEGELQAAGRAPERVTLPYRVYRSQRVFTPYRLVLRFDAPAALLGEPQTLALGSWPDGGRISLNGSEVADIATSSEHQVVRYLRPFAFKLPPGALREQANVLVFEWGSRETLVLMPQAHIGARAQLEPLIERKLFWEHTVVPASTVFALVIGLVMLAVGWRQRQHNLAKEHDYLLIGATALGWVTFNTMLLWAPLPTELFIWRRSIGFLGVGVFVMGMWVCLTRLAGWRAPPFEALCWGWVALGPLLSLGGFWVLGASHVPRTEALWAVGGALLGWVPLWAVLRATWRRPNPRLWVLAGFVLIAVALAVREALLFVFRDPLGTVFPGLQLLAPLWLATVSGILVQDFVRSLRAAAHERAELDRRLAEREAELAVWHARERELAGVQERQRIMQDMHDGLGSQLISSLAMAERGALTAPQTAELLRGCIDDLRLAIDTLTDADVDLALTAGNLRFRMAPRLRAAGLQLRWDMLGLPDALCMPGSTALPLLRVLQEALANAVKHAQAQTIQVRLAMLPPHLVLEIVDDGCGFTPPGPGLGKGLPGMHKRARSLGAQLLVTSSAQGSCVRLELPWRA